MEIGTEISHKIRSAIKAKLVELGAYVDEELPDYIMVMVANKKSVSQMRDDLDLFLGAKTEIFTAWLHDLLKKLQSIGGEPKEEVKHHKHKHRKRHSKDSHDGESTSKHRKEDLASEDSNGSQQNNAASSSDIQVPNDTDEIDVNSGKDKDNNEDIVVTKTSADTIQVVPNESVELTEKSEDSPVVEETASAASIVEQETINEEEIVPELLVKADTDEFTEELQLEEAKKTAESVQKSHPKHKPSSVTSSEPSRIAVVRKDTVIPTREVLDSQVEKRPVIVSQSERRSVVDTQIEKRSVINNTQSEKRSVISRLGIKHDSRPRAIASPIRQVSSSSIDVNRKRRGPTSIVGNVINTPQEEEEEEEYDPMNPAVGNVASVVKVTARKSSVPKSLQANKSLLMRAVSEAEKSLAQKKPTSKPSASQVVVRPMRREEQVVDRFYQPVNKQPRLELMSKSRQNDIIRKMKYTIDNEPEQPKYVIRREEVYQPAFITRPLDNRVVEYIPQPVVIIKEEPDSSEDDVVEITPPVVQPTPIVLEDSVLDNNENTMYVKARRTIKERPTPKFVVTLDGIDPEDYDENESDTSLLQQQSPEISVNKVNPPKIQPFNINLKDSDDEGEEEDIEMTPLNQVKAKERCKFWPACVNGNACQYHHPTQPCKLFPQCKFSDKCLYIHPNCKYDAKCSRPDCPYTHATRRLTPTVGVPQVLTLPHHQVIVSAPPSYHQSIVPPTTSSTKKQCLYYPNCTNMNCPFYHPTPCRFGVACRNRFCTYFHPALPTKDKLKWSKSSDSIVEKPKIRNSSS